MITGTNPLKMSAADARELTYGGDFTAEGLTVELDEQTGTSRWVSLHRIVVKDRDGKFWAATYKRGLTENQDIDAFEDETEVTFYEVEKVPVTTYEYRPVKAPAEAAAS